MSEDNAVPNQAEIKYITQNDLESFEGRIIASLSGKIDELIESKVEHKLKEERKARNGQIATLSKSVDDLTKLVNNTNAQLTGINAKVGALEPIPDLIRTLSINVASLSATINEREKKATVETQRLDERNQEQDDRLDAIDKREVVQSGKIGELDSRISVQFTKQQSLFTSVNTLRNTIHGDPTIVDGTPSLFGLITNMQTSFNTSQSDNKEVLDQMFELATSNAAAIADIKLEMARQAAIWKTRKENVIKFMSGMLGNRLLVGGGVAAGSAVAGRDSIKDMLLWLWKLLE